MMKRHCDICDEMGAHPINIPTRETPDPSGSGRSETTCEHIDLCSEHLRETLQRAVRKTGTMTLDQTLQQGRNLWKDLQPRIKRS